MDGGGCDDTALLCATTSCGALRPGCLISPRYPLTLLLCHPLPTTPPPHQSCPHPARKGRGMKRNLVRALNKCGHEFCDECLLQAKSGSRIKQFQCPGLMPGGEVCGATVDSGTLFENKVRWRAGRAGQGRAGQGKQAGRQAGTSTAESGAILPRSMIASYFPWLEQAAIFRFPSPLAETRRSAALTSL